jgi:inner membrane protein
MADVSAAAGRLVPRVVTAGWGAKAILVFALAGMMAIPGLFVFGLVLDRQHRADEVTQQVSALQGGAQQLLGPMLIAPYSAPQAPTTDANGATHPQPPETGWYVVSPEQGTASIRLNAQSLHRSIFNVPVYEADASLDARFAAPPTAPNLPSGASVDWSAARVVVGFTDLRGAKTDVGGVLTNPGGKTLLAFAPASEISLGTPGVTPAVAARAADAGSGPGYGLVSAPASALVAAKGGDLHVSLRFTGAQRLSVMPFAKSTTVRVAGNWAAPSFDGGFPPETRELGHADFQAAWSVPFIGRGLSDHASAHALSLDQLGQKDVGVSLVPTTNPYQMLMRSLKYAVMFVGLVFLTFFVFEALSGQRVHPAQYLLVGSAQMVFYLLLLSVSEYLGFDWAFAAAAVPTVLLMGLYAGAAFRSRARGVQALAVFSAVYGLIYLLMRLEDFALLAGSIASFLGLAGAMYLTRNLDWYGGKPAPPAAAPAQSTGA